MVAKTRFERELEAQMLAVKERLKPVAEAGLFPENAFCFTITASGQVLDGTLELKFKLGSNTWGSEPVQGNSLDAVVNEFIRRKGWEAMHAPLQLTGPEPQAEDELEAESIDDNEIPF